jgi:hypothetical protein
VAERAGAEVLLMPSIKRALDVDWSDEKQKEGAVETLVEQIDGLIRWVKHHVPESHQAEVAPHLETLQQVRAQDIEQSPSTGAPRIIDGVAHNRRVSIEDAEMRHGRKSKSKRFNGYKQHIAADLDTGLIAACAVTPANRPEER